MFTRSILDNCAAASCNEFPIPEDGSCSFEVDGVWFTMRPKDNDRARRAVGKDWTNKKVVHWCHLQGWRFSLQERIFHILPV